MRMRLPRIGAGCGQTVPRKRGDAHALGQKMPSICWQLSLVMSAGGGGGFGGTRDDSTGDSGRTFASEWRRIVVAVARWCGAG